MVKYIRKKFPVNAKRSKSNAVVQDLPPEIFLGPDIRIPAGKPTLKRRSYSFSHNTRSNKKKRVMKRIIRSKIEADHTELAIMLSEVSSGVPSKRQIDHVSIQNELDTEDNMIQLKQGVSMENELEMQTQSTIPKKLNQLKDINPMLLGSTRAVQNFPCFSEDLIMRIPCHLASMFHQGVREEDCDSTDSTVKHGISTGLNFLGRALGIVIHQSQRVPIAGSRSNNFGNEQRVFVQPTIYEPLPR